MKTIVDVVVIGGGLAGLTSAIHLSKSGYRVLLIEKNEFPKHKVCGEYISNEILPYFKWLGLEISSLNPSKISTIEFSTLTGKAISAELPLGGFGISRHSLDYFLAQKAIAYGCQIIQDTAIDVQFIADEFHIMTLNSQEFQSKIVLGAFGKRSNLDQKFNRHFIQKKSPWLAVKAHYCGNFPNDLVGLHNFEGGYCGVSKVENDLINICYLVDYETFKEFKNIDHFQTEVMYKNPHLKNIFEKSAILFEKPLTISQISFENKNTIDNHILMIGDTAGLIHPLCGNGMAMAVHSAKIAAELCILFLNKSLGTREQLEINYAKAWALHFKKRLFAGRILSKILQQQWLTTFLMYYLVAFPSLLPKIIKMTHGKPIIANN